MKDDGGPAFPAPAPMVKIELTAAQLKLLAPFFRAVEDANIGFKDAAIGAQIWPDGMVVKLFYEKQGRALADALGGDYDDFHSSAKSRAERGK